MKYILVLLFTIISPLYAYIDERKIDVYFANGIKTLPKKAEDNALLIEENIALTYGDNTEAFYQQIGKVYTAYNQTNGKILDIWESIAQKLNFQALIDAIFDTDHKKDIDDQVESYKKSINSGHRVLTVAHSQGNLFTAEALNKLDGWMQDYFYAISVASPRAFKIKSDTPHIAFDNDIVPWLGLVYNDTNNTTKAGSLESHAFTYYMGLPAEDSKLSTDVAKIQIMNAISSSITKLTNLDSQWIKAGEFGCGCDKRIEVINDKDPSLSHLMKGVKVLPFDENAKLYSINDQYVKASSNGHSIQENNDDYTCKDLLDTKNITISQIFGSSGGANFKAPTGLFNAQLNWGQTSVDMLMANELMSESSSGCGVTAIGSTDLELSDVYPGTYPIGVSANGYDSLSENISDTVVLSVRASNTLKSSMFDITNKYQYANLGSRGHIADIVISRPKPEEAPKFEVISSAPSTGGFSTTSSGTSSYGSAGSYSSPWYNTSTAKNDILVGTNLAIPVTTMSNPPLCSETTTECGCLPCEYQTLMYINQARMGPISGASVKLYKATQEDDANRDIIYTGSTTTSNEIDKAGVFSLPVPYPQQTTLSQEEQSFMDSITGYDGDFILEISGGFDIDRDDNLEVDSSFTQVNGKLHLILSKERLLQNDYKVNILTEIGYQLSKDLLGKNYDKIRLQTRLDDIAKRVLIEKLYPNASQPLGRDDLFYWVPMAHKEWLLKPYDETLAPIVNKIYNGENIYTDAYSYVYEDITLDSGSTTQVEPTVPVVRSQWFKVDENVTSGTNIGRVSIASDGNSSIQSFTLRGTGSELFRVDVNGGLYLGDNAVIDYEETPLYQLQLKVNNALGESKPVTLYIAVDNIEDVPEIKGFSGGVISEDAVSGTVAGVIEFYEGATAIERVEVGGANQSDFVVALNGVIKLSETASFDYEMHNSAKITVQAFNSLGGSRVVNVNFAITDAVDVPIIETLDTHLNEDASSGEEVGEVSILSNDPLLSVVLSGDGSENFTIDLNGVVKVANDSTLDYETRANYVLQVKAANIQGESRIGTIIIRIDNISDVPELNNTQLRMLEGSSVATQIGQIHIKTSGSTPIAYYTLNGNGSENFEVDNQGIVRVTNASLSRSDQQFFNLTVSATNQSGESLKAGVVIYIDTNRPILGILNSHVYENSLADTSVGTVPLQSSPTPISSLRLEGEGSENFTVNTLRQVKVAGGANLDYESTTSYALQVIATNEAGESDALPMYIRVIDRDDTIKISGFSATIYEDIPAESTIGLVSILNLGSKIISHYELSGEGSQNFTVENSGIVKISTDSQFDSTVTPKYHLALVAVDEQGIKSNQVYIDISVVKSINTIPQVSDVNLIVSEDTNVGSLLGKTSIISKTQVIEQVWLHGEGSDTFDILLDGTIILKQSVDYELKKTYDLSIYARNSLGQSEAALLHVDISNRTDDEPILSDTIFYIEENTPIGTILGYVDINTTGSSNIQSIKLSGIGAERFSVSAKGEVTLLSFLNYEGIKQYNLKAVATNTKANSPEANVIINVLNISENIPVLYNFKGFIRDDAPAQTVIGSLEFASNEDSKVESFIIEGIGKENFTIDINGTIRVSNNASLDEFKQKTYTLQIMAMNEAGNSNWVEVYILLTNDEETPFAPSNLKILDVGLNSITLGWVVDNAKYETGFNLYMDNSLYLSLDANTSSYKISDLQEGTTYLFTLKSFNDRGESIGIQIDATTDIDRSEHLMSILGERCGIFSSTFYSAFNTDTGKYTGTINCAGRSLTDDDLLNFKALKEVTGNLYLERNQLTNVDGLSNLEKVTNRLYIHSNQLTNLDGLNKLTSVGDIFNASSNQLTNVNGLSALKTVGTHLFLSENQLTSVDGLSSLTDVGGYFYLYLNQLTNLDGLSALTSVGGYFYLNDNQLTNVNGLSSLRHVGSTIRLNSNQLTNLDGLTNLTSVGDYLSLKNNPYLTDISGIGNIVGTDGKLLYIDLGQYTVKANENLAFCATTWDLQDANGDIADDMTQVCDTAEPYNPSDSDNLRNILNTCGISSSTFYSTFDTDTGKFTGTINCVAKGLTGDDLLNFKALKEVTGNLYLERNQLTNVDGLSNLEKVGSNFHIYSNQITNFDGLSKLNSVGNTFHASSNQLTNVNGLSALNTIGSHFYLHDNKLTNVDGLNSLTNIKGDLYISTNQLTNVDGLSNLTNISNNFFLNNNQLTNVNGLGSLATVGATFYLDTNQLINLDGLANLTGIGSYISFKNNPYLTDISGISNIVGTDGKLLYIDLGQYTVKANENLAFCATTWDLKDSNGDIADDMTQVCGIGIEPTDLQKLRTVLEDRCSVSLSQFTNNFNTDTGIYTGSIDCSYAQITDDDLAPFTIINEITGSLSINNNSLTKLDALSNLTAIGGYFYLNDNKIQDLAGLYGLTQVGGNINISNNMVYSMDGLNNLTTLSGSLKIYNNTNLIDIFGISNIIGFDGKEIYIDSTTYNTKATLTKPLCSSQWDIYDTTGNVSDDMSKLCDGYNYIPTDTDRLRDILGKRCSIKSLEFYNSYSESTGIYNGDIRCENLSDAEMVNFNGLIGVDGNLAIENSSVRSLNELIPLKNVTGNVSIWNNTNLIDISGISNVLGGGNQLLIIDDTNQYEIKADRAKAFCSTIWDIYNGEDNIADNIDKVCNPE